METLVKKLCRKTGAKLTILDCVYKPMGNWVDDVKRFVFTCKLSRGSESYTFEFGQSISAGNTEPTMYDILACMTKYDPYTFKSFCSSYGLDETEITNYGSTIRNKQSYRIYLACRQEFKAMERLFGDCMDDLYEIC